MHACAYASDVHLADVVCVASLNSAAMSSGMADSARSDTMIDSDCVSAFRSRVRRSRFSCSASSTTGSVEVGGRMVVTGSDGGGVDRGGGGGANGDGAAVVAAVVAAGCDSDGVQCAPVVLAGTHGDVTAPPPRCFA